jgi:hypothetical protein
MLKTSTFFSKKFNKKNGRHGSAVRTDSEIDRGERPRNARAPSLARCFPSAERRKFEHKTGVMFRRFFSSSSTLSSLVQRISSPEDVARMGKALLKEEDTSSVAAQRPTSVSSPLFVQPLCSQTKGSGRKNWSAFSSEGQR